MPTAKDVLRFIRVEHSVFALPFVLIGLLVAPGTLTLPVLGLTIAAAVGARGTAFGFNRIIDRTIDAKNPRTAVREMPRGRITVTAAWVITAVFAVLYVLACALLNPLVLKLSPLPVVAFAVYPYLKRFTWLCHLFLGFTLGFAPMGGWLAKTGSWTGIEVPFLFAFGVMFWVAGFDIVYALLDVPFDRAHGIHSIPADFGITPARVIAGAFHVVTIAFFTAAALLADLRLALATGIAAAAALLLWQHARLEPADPASVNRSAFTVNGYTGFIVLGGVLLDIAAGGF